MDYESFLNTDIHHRITSPTCEDLGIPREPGRQDFLSHSPESDRHSRSELHSSTDSMVYTIQELKFDLNNPSNPFSPYCQIPLPSPYGPYDYAFEPAFIRKRNERERERVKCVNDGYARLREHIPLENKEKRISKVETLRSAIRYIKHLQTLLDSLDSQNSTETETESSAESKNPTSVIKVKQEMDENIEPIRKKRAKTCDK